MRNRFEIGEPFETTVVAVTDSTVFVDCSAKSEGVVDVADFTDENGNVTIKEGDKVTVYFTGEVRGEMRFTGKISGDKADDAMIENAYNRGVPVEGHVEQEIKGGYEIKIGSKRAFCPYSQMGYRDREEPSYYVGRTVSFLITEYKNDGKDILVSNRKLEENAYAENIGKLATEITEGAVVKATVESIEKFGAFVNIKGFRALLPISEMSFDRISDASECVKVDEEITVKVIHTDWKKERVSVSLKALMADPWDSAAEKFPVGTKITGKISRIADFGLFINLDKGIDGLLHVSEIENDEINANTNLKKVFKVGQEYSVVVSKVDAENKRISLRSASSVEQDKTAAKYMASHDDDDGDTYNQFAALLKK